MELHYLDNGATTRPRPEVVAAMTRALTEGWGNPSSLHRLGVAAEKQVKEARAAVARLIGAPPAQLFFTSGGTEASNLAIKGAARANRRRGQHIITTRVEHSCVLSACQALEDEGFSVTYLPVNAAGEVTADQVAAALRDDTVLVSVMHVNNEVGAVQPVAEIGRLLRDHPALFHIDAVQSAGKLPIDVQKLGVDLLAISAHKLHGPKGVGALYVRQGVKLESLQHGGGQEHGVRPGTENVPGIVGFGAAAEIARQELATAPARMYALKQRILDGLTAAGIRYQINGPAPQSAAPHILNLSFEGIPRGEVLVHALEEHGVYVSTGSACHSRQIKVSHVLAAMGIGDARGLGAIRVSLSAMTTEAEVDSLVAALRQIVPEMQALGFRTR